MAQCREPNPNSGVAGGNGGGPPILSDDEYRALEERAQRYLRYALDAARQATEASPELKVHFLALARHWTSLAESVEDQAKRMR